MKKIAIVIVISITALTTYAQLPISNLTDSASYAIGLSVAKFYKGQGAGKLNASLVASAINDVFAGKPLAISPYSIDAIVNDYLNKAQEVLAKPNIDSGNAFLEKNKKRSEVKTTASGLQYEIIKEGTGTKPTATSTVVCNYKGMLLNGTEFDNSYKRNIPLTIGVNQVIAGWTEGLQLMSPGAHYKFYISYALGYGRRGSPPAIPGGSLLIFEVELLEVNN